MIKKTKILFLFVFMIALTFSCGEKSGPNIGFTLTGEDALDDGDVEYILFKVSSQPTGDAFLDSNGDGSPDVFGFPEKCIDNSPTGFSDQCGFSPQEAPFKLGGIPLDFNYRVRVFFKDSGGSIIYWGESSTFSNTSGVSDISISVEQGAPDDA